MTKILIIMGVSGCGKTTLGMALAARLGWSFEDADDYHSKACKEKMSLGRPLDDLDRQPWLERLNSRITVWAKDSRHTVLACSALKENYRRTLTGGVKHVAFVYLKASMTEIESRLRTRQHEYMSPGLLSSQFDALEEPQDAIVVDASKTVEELVREIEQVVN